MADPVGQRTDGPMVAAVAAALPGRVFWDSPILVGVSGGADSVALLLALRRLAAEGDRRRLVVAHAHHGLRPEADDDQAFVEGLADRLGLRRISGRLVVRDGVGREGLEGHARRQRYAWLAAVAHEAGARHVAVAHTADDQAETILHRALRGTGVTGLAGMKAARRLADGVALVRPLLRVRRAEVRRFLEDCDEPWREDASNRDVRFARAFLRAEVLPAVERGPYPAATDALVRLGAQAARIAGALESAALTLLERHSGVLPGGAISLDAAALSRLDPHLLAALFGALWRREGWPERDMTAAHYAALAGLVTAAAEGRGDPCCLPGGVRGTLGRAGDLRLEPPAAPRARPTDRATEDETPTPDVP